MSTLMHHAQQLKNNNAYFFINRDRRHKGVPWGFMILCFVFVLLIGVAQSVWTAYKKRHAPPKILCYLCKEAEVQQGDWEEHRQECAMERRLGD